LKLRLISIPASPYCEKARWALDRVGARYREEGHAVLLHWIPSLLRARSRTVPVLLTPHGALTDSTDILRHLDGWLAEPERLFPHGDTEVERLEDAFDEVLGPRVRRWAYAWLLDEREIFTRVIAQGLSRTERAAFMALRPVLVKTLRRAFRLDKEGVKERTFTKVMQTLEQLGVEERLADGRRYLVGDRLTAADVALASLGARMVMPDEYGGDHALVSPSVADLPEGMRKQVEAFRATRTGQAILRFYREDRRTKVSSKK
jgi:glutathione S-transferase